MAKARVFELAKELGLADEDLLRRLTSMGMTGMTQMSALEEEQVQQIKMEVGSPRENRYTEKRVGTTIIRRRKRHQQEQEEMESDVSAEAASDEEVPFQPEAPFEEPPQSAQEQPVDMEAKPQEKSAQKPPRAREVARVISRPEPSEPEQAEQETVSEEPPTEEPQPEAPVQAEASAPSEAETPSGLEGEPLPPNESESGQPPVSEEKPRSESKPKTTGKRIVERDVKKEEEKTGERPRKDAPKKRRRDEPARIIRMPDPEVKRPAAVVEAAPSPQDRKGAKVVPFRPQEQATPETEEELARKAKKKKFKKTVKSEEEDKGLPKRAFVKRKEILERDDLYDESRSRGYKGKKGGKTQRRVQKTEVTMPKAIKRRVKIASDTIQVGELARKMGVKAGEMVKKLFAMGMMANVNQSLDLDTASLLAGEFGYEIERTALQEQEILAPDVVREESMRFRPPVVTVMGHVDHGKTTLLDAIRKTNVVEGEAGGITQHIGAYHVKVGDGAITFLDTPGHEAFTAMRARGAKVTDIVILLVAADDGVMQQTKEAIDHARAAAVPIIVAVNKIDKPNADMDRVKRELAEYGIVTEEWGGDTVLVPVSAKKREGIEELLEYVVLQSELLELKADPSVNARGTVVEARLDKGKGPVATVLVQSGTLKVGDAFICGQQSGRVRAMTDDLGRPVDDAGPSIPVEVQGLSGVPMAGDEFIVLADEKMVKQIADRRQQEQRLAALSQGGAMTLEKLQKQILEGETNELNIVLKADVQGSVEALSESLQKLGNQEIHVNIVLASPGTISENDVMLASASGAIVVGFNVRPSVKIRQLAEAQGVQVRLYDVIYDVIAEIKEAMAGRLKPTYEEKVLGQAEVREVFRISKVGAIAGCQVTDGKVTRSDRVRVIRDGVVVAEAQLETLKRFKDDAKEVSQGFECGIKVSNFNDLKVGDIIESYMLEEIRPTLD